MAVYGDPFSQGQALTGPQPDFTFSDFYYNNHPDLAFNRFLRQGPNYYTNFHEGLSHPAGQSSFDENSPYGQFAQGQFGSLYNKYSADAPNHPADFSFVDFLGEHGGDVQRAWRGLTSQQRGENPGAFQGRVRWQGF